MIKLYGSGQSRSFRALWALEEAGLQFDYVEITPEIRESDEYRALNPQGKIPTLQEGSLVLTCLLYTSPSPRDRQKSRMPSSA